MPETAAGLGYGPGFALATALLHGAGIGVGLLVQKAAQMTWLRLTGAAIALTGGVLIFA